jgi:CRP/FNR family transcriptional regulator, anaerobic regulatory protein
MSNTTDILFKKTFSSIVDARDSDLNMILTKFSIEKVKKKELLVREGQVCRQLYFINNGMIRTSVNHDGADITTWVALPGTIETSAASFLHQLPSRFSLETITDCELLVIKMDDYCHLLKENSCFNIFAMKMLENFYLRMEDKFYSYLFLTAEERYLKMQSQFPEHFKMVPLKYLASILRIQPETLSRLRRKQIT